MSEKNNQNMNMGQNMGGQQPMYNGMQMPYGNGQMMQQPQTTININKDFVMKALGIVCGAMLILGIFIPYVSAYGMSRSLWDSEYTFFNILFLLLGVIPIVTFIVQKVKHLSYLTSGYALSISAFMLGQNDGFENFSVGFWFIFIAAIALLVVQIIDDWSAIKAIVPKNTAHMNPMPMPQVNQPYNAVNTANAVAPAPQTRSQEAVVCRHCGQPKKNPSDQFCQSCGQRYE